MIKDFSKQEKKILKFWKENKIFEKSIEQRNKAADFVFYEGPPTANGKPGLHHIETRVFKDIICRYKTMAGFRVLRKAGWDTHGLPVELEVEKKLGLKNKKDIEKFGITEFNKRCKESVWEYKNLWENLTERIGYWLEMKKPYITYERDYIETVWWIIKQVFEKGLLYQDYKVVPYCPRCGTSLSSHEVAQGYKRVKDTSIFVKFQIANSKFKNSKFKTYLLVWTTTPWTLPGNVAVAVNQNFTYVKVKVNTEFLILAKERLKDCGIEGKIVDEFKGKHLIGLEYEPLYKPNKEDSPSEEVGPSNLFRIIPANFVSLEEGTGLVHIAPAFGEDDLAAYRQQIRKSKSQDRKKFKIPQPVDEEGKMITPGYRWNKMFVKEADPLIILDLKRRGLLFKQELYEHDYPFCWRCKTPLLYYAKKSWFVRMTKVKKDLLKNNQKVHWFPSHLKQGRFGEWLKDVKDWAVSRERYWGTPLPIWKCRKCENIEVIGSKQDLLKQKFSTNKYFILRHGETVHQAEKKGFIYPPEGDSSISLTQYGREQIERAAKKLKNQNIDLIFASDTLRTKETAEIVNKVLNAELHYESSIRDINWGIFKGKSREEAWGYYKNGKKEKFYKAPPEGESWRDVKKRMVNFLRKIDEKYQNKNILIISHRDPLWLLEGAMKGLTNEELLAQKIEGTAIKTGELRILKFCLIILTIMANWIFTVRRLMR